MSTVELEKVLVVPTRLFHELGHFQGLSTEIEKYAPVLLDPQNTDYQPRGAMEKNPDFKQLIPYVIFQHNSTSGVNLFRYTRGSGQGEARLHAKKSIGIGGHISSLDASTACVYQQGMQRELEEEKVIDTRYTSQVVGLINDDETDVGRVHLGIVHVFEVDQPKVEAREPDITDAGFAPIQSILAEADQYESWSQICLRALYGNPGGTA